MAASLVAAGCLVIAVSGIPLYWGILVAGVALGIVHGPANPAATKAVAQWFPARSRGTAMSIKQAGLPLTGIATAALLPGVAEAIGWRPSLAATGSLVAAAGIIAYVLYREHPSHSPLAAHGSNLRAVGRQLASRNMLALGGMAGMLAGVQQASITYLVLYMKEFQGMPVVQAGLMLSVFYAGGVIGRIGWGMASDRFFGGRRKQAIYVVGGVSLVTMGMLAFADQGLPLVVLAPLTFIIGVTAMGWNGVYFAFIVELAGSTTAATAVGFSMTLQQIGNLAMPPLFGFVVDITGTYRLAWLLLVVLSLVGMGCVTLISEPKKKSV
ncbi:MAG: MFS transporter [Chloroflexi bacterium]|nr:MFS transporter [Chloroflexota bacterium]